MKDVVAGIIINEGKILIAKRSVGQKMEGKWEFPGGKIEVGETAEEALIRELKEELNENIDIEGFFYESIYKYEFGAIRLLSYKCKSKNKDFKLSVHSEIKWVAPKDILNFDFAAADIPIAEKICKENH